MVLLEDSNIAHKIWYCSPEFMNAWNMNQLWLFDVSHVDHSRKSEKGSHLFCLQHICWVIIALGTARWKKCREGRWPCRPTWPHMATIEMVVENLFFFVWKTLVFWSLLLFVLKDQVCSKLFPFYMISCCRSQQAVNWGHSNLGFYGIQHDVTNKNMGI